MHEILSFMLKWPPSVGTIAVLLGVLVGVIPWLGDSRWKRLEEAGRTRRKNLERFVCTLAFFCLCGVEWFSIASQEKEQQKQFKETSDKLTETVNAAKSSFDQAKEATGEATKSFDKAKEATDAATNSFNQAKHAVDLLTGGTSFPYIDFDSPYIGTAVARKVGKFPIHNLHAAFHTGDCDNMGIWGGCKYTVDLGTKVIPEINTGATSEISRGPLYGKSVPNGIPFEMSEVVPTISTGLLKVPTGFLYIDLSASNGEWREYFLGVAKFHQDGGWQDFRKAIRIYAPRFDSRGNTNGRDLIWECRSKGFPENQFGSDFFDVRNTYYYGHPARIKTPEEGGIAASGLPSEKVQECP